MAADRKRYDFHSGTITDNPLLIGAVTMNSANLASVPAIVSGVDYIAIILDPSGTAGDPEIVWMTAHTAAATSGTIARSQESTVAREHLLAVNWIHGPTALDFPNLEGLKVVQMWNFK